MQAYNDPAGGTPSDIGSQMNTFFWHKKAIIDAKKEMFFTPLADVMSMPKHYGKQIKVYHYVPLLDERNVNDQGIDAAGASISSDDYFLTFNDLTYSFAVQADADDLVTAVTAIEAGVAVKSGAGPWIVTMSKDTLVAGTITETNLVETELTNSSNIAAQAGAVVLQGSGNLYGSSKDVGTITGKLPTLTENGGRVNRVGFTRIERSGTIIKFGFFTEFTQESFDFDSDSELYSHLSREMVTGATQLTEAVLQSDLLAGAGTVLYAGAAVSNITVTGEGGGAAIVDHDDLMRLSIMLDENRTPKQTKVITGSRMIDTKTINSGRIMFVGSELQMLLNKMTDSFSNKAFVPVNQYADAGTILNGEIGTIDQFRIVVVPEMLNWAGAGAAVGVNPGYRSTGDNYDVYPMLVVGAESFTTIGFQTDGKTVKFKITTKMPGKETADRTDPYGEMGFSSIKWYYGTLILRPERLALIKTVAPQ